MSKNPLLIKFALIGVVVAAAAFFSYPPKERISLGLDLQGGAHLLYEVDTTTVLSRQIDLTVSRLGQAMTDGELTYGSIVPTRPGTLAVRGADPAQADALRDLFEAQLDQWDISSPGSGNHEISMPIETRTYYETTAIDSTLEIMRKRIDSLGVSEPLIQKQGIAGERILIQVPGIKDPQRLKDILQGGARLEWKALTYPSGADPGNFRPPTTEEGLAALFGGQIPADTVAVPQSSFGEDGQPVTVYYPLKRVSTVVGEDLRTANRSAGQWGDPEVSFQLTSEAGKRFEAATQANLGKQMAIVFDGEVISAPVIEGVIRDSGVIRGGFDLQRAEDLALQLRSGAIPAEVRIIEERTVGPSLGADSIKAGLTAGLASFLGVLLFMIVYYRLAGINAVVALGLNMLLVFGALGALPFMFAAASGLRATLTLPGIAGLILTVGMAVDANVLIFERVREELRRGKTVRSAVEQGFGRAFMTILDCNVTTVVAAIFLGVYGTGPVRGFAVTLIIGLIASMFTAVFVSRQLFELFLLSRPRAETLSI